MDTTTQETIKEVLIEKVLSMLYNNNNQPLDKSILVIHMGAMFNEHEADIERYLTENKLCEVKRQFGMHTYNLTTAGKKMMLDKEQLQKEKQIKWYQRVLKF